MDAGEARRQDEAPRAEALAEALRDCTGVVLAGGRSSRMGRDKAALELGGQALLARVVERLGAALPGVVVIGPAALHTLAPGVRVIPDEYPGAGPLGGLVSALRAVATSRIFLVGCDMPFVAPPLVRAMALLASDAPEADVVLLQSRTGREYLHGVYARQCLPVAQRTLTCEEPSLRRLVGALRVCEAPAELAARCDPWGLSAFNANTPEEWLRARALVGET